jgi:hypothetical protein
MGRMSPDEMNVPTFRTRVPIPVSKLMSQRLPYAEVR